MKVAQACHRGVWGVKNTRRSLFSESDNAPPGGPGVVVSTAAFHARACSASDRQGAYFESCVWRTVSSQSSHHPQEVLLAQFILYVHKGGLKPDSFHFISLPPVKLPHLCGICFSVVSVCNVGPVLSQHW